MMTAGNGSPASRSPVAYRSEIDGLRAIAVLSIIAFHAGFQWCLGGYRGVDMFFVISGFLITRIVMRDLEAGTFSFRAFYERRARRILPALFVMLTVTVAACWRVLTPPDLKLAGQNLTGILLFASNLLFWKRAGGFDFYFEPSAQLNPLLHTWSLGVEEQFYFVFPVLLFGIWRVWRRRPLAPVLLLAIVSFVWSSLLVGDWGLGFREQREANFYLLPARAWELLLGAAVALWQAESTSETRVAWWRQVATGVGVALMLYSVLHYTKEDFFYPSIYALPATMGTALVLAHGRSTFVAGLLSVRPLALVGLVSYSAYLWHQPLFALSHYLSLDDHLSTATAAGLCVISLVIAWLSWRFVEAPFRDPRRVARVAIVWGAIGAGGLLLVVGLSLALVQPLPVQGRLLTSDALLRSLTSSALPDHMRECSFDRPMTGPEDLGCALNPASPAAPTILVVGDSHAGMLLPAFRDMAARFGIQGRLVALRGCPPTLGVVAQLAVACQSMQEAALAFAERRGVTRVYLVARWAGYTDGDYDGRLDYSLFEKDFAGSQSKESARQAVTNGLRRSLTAYAAAHIPVTLVEQVPQQVHRPLGVYLQALLRPDPGAFLSAASVTRVQHAQFQAFVQAILMPYRQDARVQFIDLSSGLCDRTVCVVGTLHESYYWDANHLSEAGVRRVTDALIAQSASLAAR